MCFTCTLIFWKLSSDFFFLIQIVTATLACQKVVVRHVAKPPAAVFTTGGCYALLLSRLASDFPRPDRCRCTQSKQLIPVASGNKNTTERPHVWNVDEGWRDGLPPPAFRRFVLSFFFLLLLETNGIPKQAGMTGQPPIYDARDTTTLAKHSVVWRPHPGPEVSSWFQRRETVPLVRYGDEWWRENINQMLI